MELHTLKPAKGSIKKKKRIGRGEGSGKGGTATRGHKGAQSRSGYKRKRNYEGGQTPIQMRLPKRGFKNRNRIEYVPLNLSRIQAIVDKYQLKTIDLDTLVAKGIVRKNDRIKLLGNGALTSQVDIVVHAYSDTAKKAVETLGGSVKLL